MRFAPPKSARVLRRGRRATGAKPIDRVEAGGNDWAKWSGARRVGDGRADCDGGGPGGVRPPFQGQQGPTRCPSPAQFPALHVGHLHPSHPPPLRNLSVQGFSLFVLFAVPLFFLRLLVLCHVPYLILRIVGDKTMILSCMYNVRNNC